MSAPSWTGTIVGRYHDSVSNGIGKCKCRYLGEGDVLTCYPCIARKALTRLTEIADAGRSLHAGLTAPHDPMDVDERIERLGALLDRNRS